MFVFQLFDYYAGSRIILLVAFFECIVVGWVYGKCVLCHFYILSMYNNVLDISNLLLHCPYYFLFPNMTMS